MCTFIGLTRSKKTSVMITPKRPGAQIWQIYLADLPPVINHRCLEYHYTELGRSTPDQSSIDALNTVTPNLADLIFGRSAGQIYPPQVINYRCLEYHYTKLGRSTPHQVTIDALNTITPNLADLPPTQSSIDALHTVTLNMADLLADLTLPSIKHRCLACCYTKLDRSTPHL